MKEKKFESALAAEAQKNPVSAELIEQIQALGEYIKSSKNIEQKEVLLKLQEINRKLDGMLNSDDGRLPYLGVHCLYQYGEMTKKVMRLKNSGKIDQLLNANGRKKLEEFNKKIDEIASKEVPQQPAHEEPNFSTDGIPSDDEEPLSPITQGEDQRQKLLQPECTLEAVADIDTDSILAQGSNLRATQAEEISGAHLEQQEAKQMSKETAEKAAEEKVFQRAEAQKEAEKTHAQKVAEKQAEKEARAKKAAEEKVAQARKAAERKVEKEAQAQKEAARRTEKEAQAKKDAEESAAAQKEIKSMVGKEVRKEKTAKKTAANEARKKKAAQREMAKKAAREKKEADKEAAKKRREDRAAEKKAAQEEQAKRVAAEKVAQEQAKETPEEKTAKLVEKYEPCILAEMRSLLPGDEIALQRKLDGITRFYSTGELTRDEVYSTDEGTFHRISPYALIGQIEKARTNAIQREKATTETVEERKSRPAASSVTFFGLATSSSPESQAQSSVTITPTKILKRGEVLKPKEKDDSQPKTSPLDPHPQTNGYSG